MKIDIQQSIFFKYFIFGSLYFTEGLNKAFAAVILPIYFLDRGVPPELITIVIGIAAVPMIIKFIWGGIVDYFIIWGRRRFIFIGGMLSTITLFILAFIDPGIALIPFGILVFISWTGVGFLDVSCDALAIEISEEHERGKINGAMYAGQSIGLTVGVLILPIIAKTFDYYTVFLTAGFIILFIIVLPLCIKEVRILKKRPKTASLILTEFKKKTTLLISLLLFLVALSSGMLLLFIPLFLDIELGLDIDHIGLITGVFTIALTIGSLVGGMLADRWGRKTALYVLISGSVLVTASLVFTTTWQTFTILYAIIGFLQGGYYVSYMAMSMDITNPKVGATQFSILMGLGNLGIILGGMVSGPLYVLLGFQRMFLYAAWIFGPSLLLLHFIKHKKNY